MSTETQYAFNLIFNAVFSFFAGLFIVSLGIRLFRINRSRWMLFFLSLPFVKILWDLACRGIPTSSIVYSGLNPLALPPKHQTLTLGVGFSQFGPVFNGVLSAFQENGKRYSVSGADYLYAGLAKHLGEGAPAALLGAILSVSLLFILRRFWTTSVFEQVRKNQRPNGTDLGKRPLKWRSVDLYSSPDYEGTPFTGGVFRPYICLPVSTIEKLSPQEQEAVIQHEMAHIRHGDLLVTLLIRTLGDLFWFVPGYRSLSRKMDRLREILADQSAVQFGASPVHLASALLKLKEIPEGIHHSVLHSAFFREKALLQIRVESLLDERQQSVKSRLGWNNRYLRVLIAVWMSGAVMTATFGGNHEVNSAPVPAWAKRVLKNLGWMSSVEP